MTAPENILTLPQSCVQGNDWIYRDTLLEGTTWDQDDDPDGEDLTRIVMAGKTAVLQVRDRQSKTSTLLAEATVVLSDDPDEPSIVATIPYDVTADMPVGDHWWELDLIEADDTPNTMVRGSFVVEPEVTI